jgi:adenine-specific DNA-methyltransferase
VQSIGSDPKSLAGRPSNESDLLGQVFTPQEIAARMATDLLREPRHSGLTILDPAVGPATFPISMLATGKLHNDDKLVLRDIDKKMVTKTRRVFAKAGRSVDLKRCDYLEEEGGPYDLVIMNPPYVRQEWIDKKDHYRAAFRERYSARVPGTSNLYVYFIVKALAELKQGGKMVCIVYDSWLFTKFGRWLAGVLQANCGNMDTTNVGQQPFQGRLIDATIITATRTSKQFIGNPDDSAVVSMREQSWLSGLEGVAPVHSLFHTKRGLRLKQSAFFLIDLKEGLRVGATPFVKKLGHLRGYTVRDDHPEAALLQYPGDSPNPLLVCEIDRRLQLAQDAPDRNVAILTWHKERPESWFLHRKAPYAPILFNYYLRGRPRHIYNRERVFADNFYGLTPSKRVDPLIPFAIMNSTCVCLDILHRTRNQGHGLQKIQLYEYREALVPDWTSLSKSAQGRLRRSGEELLEAPDKAPDCLRKIDDVIARELGADQVSLPFIHEKLREYDPQSGKVRRN